MHSNEQTSLCKYRFLLWYQHNATIPTLLSKTPSSQVQPSSLLAPRLTLRAWRSAGAPPRWACRQFAEAQLVVVLALQPQGKCKPPRAAPGESLSCPGPFASDRQALGNLPGEFWNPVSELWLGSRCFCTMQCQGSYRVVHLQIPLGNAIDLILLKWGWVSSAPHHVSVHQCTLLEMGLTYITATEWHPLLIFS